LRTNARPDASGLAFEWRGEAAGGATAMVCAEADAGRGHRAMWSAKGEAAVRTVVATARLTSGAGTFSTVLGTIGA
jgi:transposase